MASRAAILLALVALIGCGVRRVASGSPDVGISVVANELDQLSGSAVSTYRRTFRAVLEDAIDKDSFVCLPSPREVFFSNQPDGERVIRGAMPHYGFFFGPMRYVIRRRDGQWH